MNETLAYETLRKYRFALTKDQTRMLKGQIRSGDVDGAVRGLNTILKRKASNAKT